MCSNSSWAQLCLGVTAVLQIYFVNCIICRRWKTELEHSAPVPSERMSVFFYYNLWFRPNRSLSPSATVSPIPLQIPSKKWWPLLRMSWVVSLIAEIGTSCGKVGSQEVGIAIGHLFVLEAPKVQVSLKLISKRGRSCTGGKQGWDPTRKLSRAFRVRLVVQLKYCSLKI